MTPIKRRLLYIFRNSLLRLRISWDHGKMLTISVGYHVDKIDAKGKIKWDGSRCVRNTTHGEDKVPAAIINKVLEQLENRVDEAFLKFESIDIIPSIQQLKSVINPTQVKSNDLGSLIKEYRSEQSVLNQWSERTKRLVKQSLDNVLELYGENCKLDSIDENGLVKLINYMTTKPCFKMKHDDEDPEKKIGLSNNTINRYMSFIRSFARWTIEKGYCKESALLKKSKYLKTVNLPVIFLTMDELERFMSVELTPAKREVAEAFCFCCFTGLRYSDLSDLRWSQVKESYIEIVTKKTHDRITIELNNFSKEILSKKIRGNDEDKVFYVINNADFNKAVKEIAKKAKIEDPVKIVTYSGAERITTTLPKWHYITSHTPRKTFVTNALSLGISPTIVMKWTGHKNFKAMKPYVDIVSKAKQKNMELFNEIGYKSESKDIL